MTDDDQHGRANRDRRERTMPPWFTELARGWEERDLCRVAFSERGNALNPRYSSSAGVTIADRVVLRINFKRGGWRALLGFGPFPFAAVMGLHGEILEVPISWLIDP